MVYYYTFINGVGIGVAYKQETKEKSRQSPAAWIFTLVATVPSVEDATAVAAKLAGSVDCRHDGTDLSDPRLDHLLIGVPDVLPGDLLGTIVPAW